MLRDLSGDDPIPQLTEIVEMAPDVLALQGFDFDLDGMALAALQIQLERAGHAMEFAASFAPNTGVVTGFDLNRNGRLGEPQDAQGYGRFAGQDGIALLSRFPIETARGRDFTDVVWSEMAWSVVPKSGEQAYFSDAEWAALKLFSVAGFAVPVLLPEGELWVLTGQSTPPVFDGPEDRNGLRNAAQIGFWSHLARGGMVDGWQLPSARWVFAGGLNADAYDGDGPHGAMKNFLDLDALSDPRPEGPGGAADPDADHASDPALDTVRWRRDKGPGNLRVDYVLPSRALGLERSGVNWPVGGTDEDAFRHFPVWVDVSWQ